MRHVALTMILGLTLAALTPPPAAAAMRQPAPAAGEIDPRAVVAEVRRIIAERYVLPERRPALDAVLAEGLASGRYDVREPGALAERINADLARVGNDRHLSFGYNPQQAALLSGPRGEAGPNPQAFARQARDNNHGVKALRVLPGNVRYMDYDAFLWTGDESAAALETAMRFLAGGDAAIIDLRRNGGGSPRAVQYLISHFLPPERPLVTFYMNGEPSPDRLSTLPDVPAGRMIGKPLYVLTSGGTASAAEEFTGHVGGYRIGELVGETTAGAGFRNALVPIPGGFVLSVSVGRAVLASTGRDWEAVGIGPTMPSTVAGALDAAHIHALRRLATAAPGPERERLEALADGVAARSEARAAALPLAAYAGSYGERALVLEGGRLFYRRGERPATALIALGGNSFAFEDDPALRIDFQVEDGRVTAVVFGPAGGPSQGRYERTS